MSEAIHPTRARLALPDGSVFVGVGFGATGRPGVVAAEVVFNTALTGYQESLTDPSYSGQILVQTTPMIGNTGANRVDEESGGVQVAGFVVHELARRHSNYRAGQGLSDYLRASGVLGIAGVDTRALTRSLRTAGVVPGAMTDDESVSDAALVEAARSAPSMAGQNLAAGASCGSVSAWDEGLGEWSAGEPADGAGDGAGRRVLALDCGAKRNILRHLAERGCAVEVAPFDTPADRIRARFEAGEIDGVFISNGPGDPAAVEATVATLRALLEETARGPVPMFGICLGHQLLALAVGAETFKLPFGHRGANQPVGTDSGRVVITSQNHGFAVDPDSLRAAGGVATHTHLNDGTLAGFRLVDRPVFGVQFHPEASPGPHDAGDLFDDFVRMMNGKAVARPDRGAAGVDPTGARP